MHASLFLGNDRNGLFVPNIEAAARIDGNATGEIRRKCVSVAPRFAHCLAKNDGLVLYDPISDAFLGYLEDLYGFSPRIFAPKDTHADPDARLSIVEAILNDADLMKKIADVGRALCWTIAPFIPHKAIFTLAKSLCLPVSGMTEANVLRGSAGLLNDKAEFQRVCHGLQINVPDSIVASSWDDLLRAANVMFNEHRAIMLRQSRTNGGLGLMRITQNDLRARDFQRIESYLEDVLSRENWAGQAVLVEPILPVRCSPSILFWAASGQAKLVSHTMQVLKGDAYIGSLNPSGLQDALLGRLVEKTRSYVEHAMMFGAEGFVGIDWGVLEGGGVVAFESNARYGGQTHVLAIARRLCGDRVNSARIQSCDALPVSSELRLEELLDAMRRRGCAWDASRGVGVVISIPPSAGSMGYVAIAETAVQLTKFVKDMATLAETLHKDA